MDNNVDFRVLVIDDNTAIHEDFIKILSADAISTEATEFEKLNIVLFGKKSDDKMVEHFEIDTASQGQEGVARIKEALKAGRPYSLAFVDIRMPPGWDGIETIKHIWELDKDIQIVICTAYSDYSWEETVGHLGKTDNLLILKKPFDNVSVRQLTCALTKKWQLLRDSRKYTATLKQQVEERTVSLQKSLSLVKATLESSNDGILVIDKNKKVIDYNQKLTSLWQLPRHVLEKNSQINMIDYMKNLLVDSSLFFNKLDCLQKNAEEFSIDILKFKDGRIFECYSQPQVVDDEIVGCVLSFHDITKRSKLEEELQHQATHDALTGLPNRVMLLSRLHNEIRKAEQKKTGFVVIFIDLDRFKLINDSLSHAVGDELLRAAAMRLQASVRPEDTLARLGGDEFVIILSNVSRDDDVILRAHKIKSDFQQPFNVANRLVTVTTSMGISVYPKDGETVDILLRNADAAMYSAKENGANKFEFYAEEMNTASVAKLDQEMQLRQALENNEFFLCYQPQYALNGNKLVAMEALIRWNNPKKGPVVPIDFIPLAEETGLIVEIGEWAMRTACKQNKAWQDMGLPPIRVAVNVALPQIKKSNFVATVKAVLEQTGLKPEYLELELTENVIINTMEVIKTVTELKSLGVTIAIDDFGTGYSSLSYLKRIPLDRLKIDSSFIQHIQSKDDDEVIIRAIIAIAQNLDLEVIAEGVETQNQLDFLKNNKCNEIQGYYYSKPLSTDEMEKLMKETNKVVT